MHASYNLFGRAVTLKILTQSTNSITNQLYHGARLPLTCLREV
jgi:hypothetical protein